MAKALILSPSSILKYSVIKYCDTCVILMQKIAITEAKLLSFLWEKEPVPSLILTHKVAPSLSLLIHPEAVLYALQLLSHVKGNFLYLTSWTAFPQESEVFIA